MANISAKMVKELREKTGVGMMDCKKALVESDGDMEKAIEYLRKKGIAKAAKKADREANEGYIGIYEDDNKITIVEINCETDFVGKNENFRTLVNEIAKMISNGNYKIKSDNVPSEIQEIITENIAKIGENIKIGENVIIELGSNDTIGKYVHMDGKIGVVVVLSCERKDMKGLDDIKVLAKDIAMHIAATNPQYISRENVDKDVIEKERDIYREQMKNSGKPENIVEKIVEGKLNKFFEEICLLEQSFVKQPEKKVKDIIHETITKTGGNIEVRDFVRIQIGTK